MTGPDVLTWGQVKMLADLAGIPDDAPVMSDAGELVTGVDRDEMRDGTPILVLFLETIGD